MSLPWLRYLSWIAKMAIASRSHDDTARACQKPTCWGQACCRKPTWMHATCSSMWPTCFRCFWTLCEWSDLNWSSLVILSIYGLWTIRTDGYPFLCPLTGQRKPDIHICINWKANICFRTYIRHSQNSSDHHFQLPSQQLATSVTESFEVLEHREVVSARKCRQGVRMSKSCTEFQ
jgi:hypothetical protein